MSWAKRAPKEPKRGGHNKGVVYDERYRKACRGCGEIFYAKRFLKTLCQACGTKHRIDASKARRAGLPTPKIWEEKKREKL